MTPTTEDLDRRAVAISAQRELCKRSLAAFAKLAWKQLEPAIELKWGWALDAICEHLEAITNGDLDRPGEGARLLINVPPGSMKSLLVGVFWPAWEWGPRGMPSLRYLGTAHKQDLAVRDNMKCRRLIQSRWFQNRWPIALADDQNAKSKFENEKTGFREAMAFGSLTGSRGDRVIIDDPHSVDDANSPTILAADVKTFREAIPSRVQNDKSAIIIIMQRLNEGDVAGVALDLGYDHLCIPMRFDKDRDPPLKATPLGWKDPRKRDGQLMFPERFPEESVASLEKSLGSYAAAGQLQQNPKPRSGGMFQKDWFEIVDEAPANLDEVRAWDFAASVPEPGRDPDSTAKVKIGRCLDGFFWILDAEKFQRSAHEVRKSLKNTASQDGKACRIRLPQDPGQAGKAQAQQFIRDLAGYIVKAVPPTGNKETRAEPMSAQAEAGNIKLKRGPWNEAFLEELSFFPFGKHDDFTDAAADAFNELADPDGHAGFLSMVRQDNAQAAEEARAEAEKAQATAAPADGDDCPYPKGSLEYLKFHGLVS
jgi:predicted phage terminase large subunit-like protein